MKKIVLAILLVLSAVLTYAQDSKTLYETRSLSNETIMAIEMQTSGGLLSVTASDSSEARLEIYIKGNGKELSKEEIKEILSERYDLSVSVTGNNLTAIAKQQKDKDWNWKKGLTISFKVYVPKAVSTKLSTSGGSIHLTGITGDQDFSTSGGSLHVTE